MEEEAIIFSIALALGAIATLYSYVSMKSSIRENKAYLRYRFMGTAILSFGFTVHSLGDFFQTVTELSIESAAHVIIFISFIFFIYASYDILKNAKRYWLK